MRLIDADELERLIKSGDDLIFDTATEREILHMIDNQETKNAIPIIYGVILETTDINGEPFKYCSNCKYPLPKSNVMNYCNCCGSDFRSPDSFPFSKELAEGIADIVCETVEEQLKKRGGADNADM